MTQNMTAFVVNKVDSEFSANVVRVPIPKVGEGESLIRVLWSSINYKDGLASIEEGKVITSYPRILGIDIAGVVVDSSGTGPQTDSYVFANGYELGVNRDGGFAQYCSVPSNWLIEINSDLEAQKVMTAGTAGFTAAQSVLQILEKVPVDRGPVLVTGATGGVGSFAVALLSNCGYEVVASTGRADRSDWLKSLGATQVMGRLPESVKPLEKESWAAVVDTVGGMTLQSALASTKYSGIVTTCGNTGGSTLSTSVFPFILRSITLIGIDSVNVEMHAKTQIWKWLLTQLPSSEWQKLTGKIAEFETLSESLSEVLAGQTRGRTLVQIG